LFSSYSTFSRNGWKCSSKFSTDVTNFSADVTNFLQMHLIFCSCN
jgi:hypothetical protein